MAKTNMQDMIRELINKIYNEPNLKNDLLDEIENDLKKISALVDKNKAYRELLVLVDAARSQKNVIGRSKFKFAILSDLEKEYKKIATQSIQK